MTGQKPLSGPRFFLFGLALMLLKYGIDASFAFLVFGEPWLPWDYLRFRWSNSPLYSSSTQEFLLALLCLALPFLWVGLSLTLRRVRTLGWPTWTLCLFFVPYLNLLFFLLLSVAHPQTSVPSAPEQKVFHGPFQSALLTVGIVVAVTLLLVGFTANFLQSYGWGLFVGVPFLLGFVPGLAYRAGDPESSFSGALGVSILSILGLTCGFLAIGMEGFICILMAAPLAGVIAFMGVAFGWMIRRSKMGRQRGTQLNCMAVLLVPLLCVAEKSAALEQRLIQVTTSVEIDAPSEAVWSQVIAFPELPPPRELIFRAGIAYPIRAEINGHCVGALRLCVFSTGAFVEPIEIWDQPRLLRFSVTSNPPPMTELSPYKIDPPHLRGFLESRAGQFQLVELKPGKTRLEGTTWYTHGLWPHYYWQLWSDHIIHTIHLRVLSHIKALAESPTLDLTIP